MSMGIFLLGLFSIGIYCWGFHERKINPKSTGFFTLGYILLFIAFLWAIIAIRLSPEYYTYW